jgi:hypothetical protein
LNYLTILYGNCGLCASFIVFVIVRAWRSGCNILPWARLIAPT